MRKIKVKGYAILLGKKNGIGIDQFWPYSFSYFAITPYKNHAEKYVKDNPKQKMVEVEIKEV